MRVAINGLFWNEPHSGSGQYLHHLWDALHEGASRDPLQFTLLLPTSSQSEPGNTRRTRFAAKLGNRKVEKLIFEEWGVARAAQRAGAHLLHVPYLAAPLRSRMPIVLTAHDMIPWVVPGYADSPIFKFYMALAVAGARRAQLIMADSEASRRDAIKILRVSPEKVKTVYLGVEPPEKYTPEQLDKARERFGLPPHFAFYIGGFDRRKNVPLLLETWRDALGSLQGEGETPVLAIAGGVPLPGGIFPDVRGEAESLGLGGEEGAVRFLGRISEEDKPLLMSAARLFIYPSAYEGFGLDPLEAMSLGTPVVSSSGGSLQEVVGEGGLLVQPDNRAELRGAVVQVWQDRELRLSLSRRGRAHASNFTWERTAAETVRVYKQAVQRRNKA